MAEKILICDDSELILAKTGDLLRGEGFEVLTSHNAWVAKVVREEQPDLILMDVSFGTKLGPIAVQALKRHNVSGNAKILLYSGRSDKELDELARECGADGFISKDNSDAEFIYQIRRVLRPGGRG